MERRFNFLAILDYLMLMESVALFTSDFFGSQPYATERHLTWQKVFAEQLCFQASATIVTAKLFSLIPKLPFPHRKDKVLNDYTAKKRSLDDNPQTN